MIVISIICFQQIFPLPPKNLLYLSLTHLPIYIIFLTKSWEKQLVHLSTNFVKCRCSSRVKSAVWNHYGGDRVPSPSLLFYKAFGQIYDIKNQVNFTKLSPSRNAP